MGGPIGAINALSDIHIEGHLTTESIVTAIMISIHSNASFIPKDSVTGNTYFVGYNSSISLNGGTITGNVDSTLSTAGTLISAGNSTITGAIGATNALSRIIVQQGTFAAGSFVDACFITIEEDGTFFPGGNVTADVVQIKSGSFLLGANLFTGMVDFSEGQGHFISNKYHVSSLYPYVNYTILPYSFCNNVGK